MYDVNRATVEANLARAHRAIVAAKNAADNMNEDGLWLDLQMLEVEVTRLAEDSLRSKRRKPLLGQTSITDSLPSA